MNAPLTPTEDPDYNLFLRAQDGNADAIRIRAEKEAARLAGIRRNSLEAARKAMRAKAVRS